MAQEYFEIPEGTPWSIVDDILRIQGQAAQQAAANEMKYPGWETGLASGALGGVNDYIDYLFKQQAADAQSQRIMAQQAALQEAEYGRQSRLEQQKADLAQALEQRYGQATGGFLDTMQNLYQPAQPERTEYGISPFERETPTLTPDQFTLGAYGGSEPEQYAAMEQGIVNPFTGRPDLGVTGPGGAGMPLMGERLPGEPDFRLAEIEKTVIPGQPEYRPTTEEILRTMDRSQLGSLMKLSPASVQETFLGSYKEEARRLQGEAAAARAEATREKTTRERELGPLKLKEQELENLLTQARTGDLEAKTRLNEFKADALDRLALGEDLSPSLKKYLDALPPSEAVNELRQAKARTETFLQGLRERAARGETLSTAEQRMIKIAPRAAGEGRGVTGTDEDRALALARAREKLPQGTDDQVRRQALEEWDAIKKSRGGNPIDRQIAEFMDKANRSTAPSGIVAPTAPQPFEKWLKKR